MRLLVLVAAALLSLASSSPPRRQSSYAQPGVNPSYPARSYYCFTLETPRTTTSECAPSPTACEQARQSAIADGITTSDCVSWSPVACFQLGGDPAPDASFCAANLDDCEGWRAIDREKNGTTGDACALRQ